jgi:hypothetical protein
MSSRTDRDAGRAASSALPALSEKTPVREVFGQLARYQKGSFILLRDGQPTRYVQGRALAEALIKEEGPGRSRRDLTLADLRQEGLLDKAAREVGPELFEFRDTERTSDPAGLEAFLAVDPPVFLCTNPDTPHRNFDWNSGDCEFCPYPLGSIEE